MNTYWSRIARRGNQTPRPSVAGDGVDAQGKSLSIVRVGTGFDRVFPPGLSLAATLPLLESRTAGGIPSDRSSPGTDPLNASQCPSHATDRTSLTLLERLRAMDRQGWRELVILYGPLVAAWCRRSGLGEEDAADVVQEVFAAVAGKIGGFRRDKPGDTFRGWLRVIARNEILMHRRRLATRPPAGIGGSTAQLRLQEFPEPWADEAQVDSSGEQSQFFHRGLELIRSEFEPATWQAFWQVTVEDRPSETVAQQLGMSRGAVRQAKYKVLKRLRAFLGDLEP